MRQYLSVVFLSLVSLVHLNRVTSRSWQIDPEITRPVRAYEKNIEVENLIEKRKQSGPITNASAVNLPGDLSCNCRNYCPDPNGSELEKLIWIENNPMFCKATARIDIEEKPYLAACFFFCCRKCNINYHNCVVTDVRENCLQAAYKCAGICVEESLLNITIKGW
ncbi:hypothetical protein OS493_031893 [Desmophyllum pertusum]|uniref:Uncharacterized protein n=1 Tax=Desmophyllum pertusum TaxID=174260 RepID=A0A9W9Y8I0_9CNID|nr:hypothetical protein OS493_031893 [Desmophyllum pertusum]